MLRNKAINFTKRAPWQYKASKAQARHELVEDLREEERDLIETLAVLKASQSNQIIDNGEPRNSLNYEESLRHRLAQIRDALVRIGH